MNSPLPTDIPGYLAHLRRSLAGADPSLVQDALYDAEEYLRSELAEHPGRSEAEVIASVASSYGAPDEVAGIYRETETRVESALRTPLPQRRRSTPGRVFSVLGDARAYAALFYMLLALATGIFYFSWVLIGLSLSAGLSVLIIGIPFVILYFGSVRLLSLVEGRLVEVMLGERMPRRPLYGNRGKPWLSRIGDMFMDPRTWTAQLYFLLMLPLGIAYFVVAVTMLTVAIAFIASPLLAWLATNPDIAMLQGVEWQLGWSPLAGHALAPWIMLPLLVASGIATLLLTLHVARGIGYLHAQLAKRLLVKTAQHA